MKKLFNLLNTKKTTILNFIIVLTIITLIIINPLLSISVILYFLPSTIAAVQNKKNFTAIIVTNIIFGWTILGWIVCLIWSLLKD